MEPSLFCPDMLPGRLVAKDGGKASQTLLPHPVLKGKQPPGIFGVILLPLRHPVQMEDAAAMGAAINDADAPSVGSASEEKKRSSLRNR